MVNFWDMIWDTIRVILEPVVNNCHQKFPNKIHVCEGLVFLHYKHSVRFLVPPLLSLSLSFSLSLPLPYLSPYTPFSLPLSLPLSLSLSDDDELKIRIGNSLISYFAFLTKLKIRISNSLISYFAFLTSLIRTAQPNSPHHPPSPAGM